jgi:hypothetical protein
LGACHGVCSALKRSISISYRRDAVSAHHDRATDQFVGNCA